jgi:hypothetical protein
MFKKDAVDHLGRNIAKNREEKKTLHTIKGRKVNGIVYILPRNCLQKHVTGGKIEGKSDGKTREKKSAAIG